MVKREVHSDERAELREKAEKISGFAGISSEFTESGPAPDIVRFTHPPSAEVLESLLSQISDRSMVRFDFTATRSLRELVNAATTLADAGEVAGAQLHGVSVDIDNNIVRATISQDEATLRGLDSGAIVDGMRVDVGEPAIGSACPTRRDCDQPLRAGVEAKNIPRVGLSGNGCTTGFAMKSQDTDKYYITTAEHCGNNGDAFYISDVAIRSQKGESPDIDIAIIEIFSSDESNVLFKTAGDTLKRITNQDQLELGDSVCLHSFKVGRSCGVGLNPGVGSHSIISAEGSDTYVNGFDFQLVLPGDWVCDEPEPGQRSPKGSSGGPITSPWGSKAYGTLSSCALATYDGTSTVVRLRGMHISEIEAALFSPWEITLMTSAAE